MQRLCSSFSAALLALAAGCTSTGTAIETDQGGRLVSSARVSIGFRGDTPADPHDGLALELGAATVKGRSTQTLASGQRVELGGETFNGPTTIENETRATMLDGAFRWRRFTASRVLGIELLGGLSYANLEFTSTGPAEWGREGLGKFGLLGGLGGIWRIGSGTSLHARYSSFATFRLFEETDVRRLELALAQALGRHFIVRAGYQSWAIESKQLLRSEVSTRLRGPSLGLELAF
jgi:hypothetical protein